MRYRGSLLVLAAVAAAVAVAVRAAPIPTRRFTTNRERLARKLPPLPPKFGRMLPGHAGDARALVGRSSASISASPSPSSFPSPSPSPSPSSSFRKSRSVSDPGPFISYTGRIQVRNATTNDVLGYLENKAGGVNGINLGTGEDLYVNFKATSSGNGPFDIIAQNPKFSGPAYLGGRSPNSSPILRAGLGSTVNFVNVQQTSQGSRPVKYSAESAESAFWSMDSHIKQQTPQGLPPAQGTVEFGESSIWSIKPHTKQLMPHWINPNGGPAPTNIAYSVLQNTIFFTGNIDEYNKLHPVSQVSLVEFYVDSN